MKRLLSFLTALMLTTHLANSQTKIPCDPVDIGKDSSYCYYPGMFVSLIATSKGYNSIYWQSNGTGAIPYNDITPYFTDYEPTAQDYKNGSVQIIATNIGDNSCIPSHDTLLITFRQSPSINLGKDFLTCDWDSIPLHASTESGNTITWMGGDGKFIPDNHSVDAVYFPGSKEKSDSIFIFQASVQNTNGCSTHDTLFIQKISQFYVYGGQDQSYCDTLFPLDGISNSPDFFWSTTGTGKFSPDNKSLHPTYIPSSEDLSLNKVLFVLNAPANNGCGATADTSVIHFTAGNMKVTTYGDACKDSLYFWIAGIGNCPVKWSSTGTGDFVYQMENPITIYDYSAEDRTKSSIEIIANFPGNSKCGPASDTLKVKMFPRIVVNAGPDQQRYGYSDAKLSGTIQNGSIATWATTGSGTFTDIHDLNATYLASSEDLSYGSVQLTLSTYNAEQCSAADQVAIYFNDFATISGFIYYAGDTGISSNVSLYKNVNGGFVLDTTLVFSTIYQFRRTAGEYIVLAHAIGGDGTLLPTYSEMTTDWHNAKIINLINASEEADIWLLSVYNDYSWLGSDSISGYVTLDGTATNSNLRTSAAVLKGANVFLIGSTGGILTSTTTDANGHYAFGTVAKGNYTLRVDYPQLSNSLVKVSVDGNPQTMTLADLKPTVEPIEGLMGAAEHNMVLNFYPNPAKETLTINIPAKLSEHATASIVSLTGVSVLTTSVQAGTGSVELNVQLLPQGFYVLQLSDGNNTYRNKFYKTN